MSGDTAVDVAAGAGAGARVIAVGWGHGTEAGLRAAGAPDVARHPGELLEMLLGEPGHATTETT